MGEEIKMRDAQLKELDSSLQELFDGLQSSKRKELDLDEIKDKIHSYNNALDSFKMELRTQQPTDKAVYKSKAKTYTQNHRKYKTDLDWAVAQLEKNELFEGAGQGAVDNSAEGKMQQGLAVQQDSKESLQRTMAKVAETQDIGREVAVKLENQTDQLDRMHDDLKETSSTLERSNVIMRRMGRKLKTDKYVWVIVLLVIGAIVAIIIWKLVDPSANVNVPDGLIKDGKDKISKAAGTDRRLLNH